MDSKDDQLFDAREVRKETESALERDLSAIVFMRTKGRMFFREMFVMTMWTKGNGRVADRRERKRANQYVRLIFLLL